jgi:hypothetical protein
MDIDAMSVEERTKLMKEGKCFRCKKPGHLASECPDKLGKKPETQTKKMSGKDLHAHIRSLFKEMTSEEQHEFFKQAEDEGF